MTSLGHILFVYVQYFQVFLFMFLFNRHTFDFPKFLFPLSWIGFYTVLVPIYINSFNIQLYSSMLILFYGSIILAAYFFGLFRFQFSSLKALSFSFLIVFLNSYFWEAPLHLIDLIEKGITLNWIVQLYHLLPLLVLRQEFKIKNGYSLAIMVLINFIQTLLIIGIRVNISLPYLMGFLLPYIDRGISFFILLYIFSKLLDRKC